MEVVGTWYFIIMEDTKIKRKRSSKTTRTQYMLYLETLENNEHFRNNKFSPGDENILRESWELLTTSLNSSGGPQRSTNAWKRIFSDWKSAVRKRARTIRVGENKTGGGPPEKPLNDLEQKLIDLVNTTIETSSDQLPVEQTDNVQLGSCNRTNPAVSEMLTGSERGLRPPKKESKQAVKKRSTFVGSVQNYLKHHIEVDYRPILGDLNHNLKELVATEQQKLKLNCLRLQLQYPDVDIERSLADEAQLGAECDQD